MVTELITSETIKLLFKWSSDQLKTANLKIDSSENELHDALNHHLKIIKNWSSEVTFKDLKAAKSTERIYIDLDLLLYPKRIRMSEDEKIASISLTELLKKEVNHIALLGQPGAGKTTSMKHLCQSIIHNENFFPDDFGYPILVKLRDFNKPTNTENTAGIIVEYLFNSLGLKIKESNSKSTQIINNIKEKLVCEILDKMRALLIIEGLDEITYKKHKSIILEEIPRLANQLEGAKMIVTSRTADYTFSFENIAEYEFCPLTDDQIKNFSQKWLTDQEEAKNFFNDIKNSPFYDTAIRPLTVAHLCAIYERGGRIPDKPKTVYKKIINLLLEDWDEQRNIIRRSNYGSFETDRKFDFLSTLAYFLTVSTKRTIFNKQTLLSVYQKIYLDFDLEFKEANSVIQEIESHTGLFLECGFEMFEFAHKSLQEYLTAEYLVKLPSIPQDLRLIELLANELAVAISISSNSSIYFIELVFNRLRHSKLSLEFFQTFINRLLLEKPDFNNDENVGVAALILYTIYLNSYQEAGSKLQLSLFTIDDLTDSFEKFIKQIFRRNSKEAVLDLYKIVASSDSTNGLRINTLQLKKRSQIYPEVLLCRENFLL